MKQNQTFPSLLSHSSIPCFLPFPPPETISEAAERPTLNPFTTTPSSTTAAAITTAAPLYPNVVWAIPPPWTADTEATEQPTATTPFPTITYNRTPAPHHQSIHIQPQPPQSTATAATTSSSRNRPVSSAIVTPEGSGSGEPSGDDQTEEEDEQEEEDGSGVPTEASGTEEPVGKFISFTSLPYPFEGCVGRPFFFKNWWEKLIVSS